MYAIHGSEAADKVSLDHFAGYRGARPGGSAVTRAPRCR